MYKTYNMYRATKNIRVSSQSLYIRIRLKTFNWYITTTNLNRDRQRVVMYVLISMIMLQFYIKGGALSLKGVLYH